MNVVPPAILDLRVARQDARPLRLWLPLVLLWPLGFALGLVALVITTLVDVVLLLIGQRYHHHTLLLVRSFLALNETKGMAIRVHADDQAIDITVL